MTTHTVSTRAQLLDAIARAGSGDQILLGPGAYGDVDISRKVFDVDVTISSANPNNPAVFSSLNITESSGIKFDRIDVDFVPNASTLSHFSAVRIFASSDIAISNSEIEGGPAVNGVPQSATVLDDTGNVIGLPTGRGLTIDASTDVVIDAVNIHQFGKGVVLNDVAGVSVVNSEFHHVRTSPIVGTKINDILIQGNELHTSNPWNWGAGDHGDFIHFWTSPNQVGPSDRILILDNVISQGTGFAILGIFLENSAGAPGYTGVQIEGNVIANANAQGLRLEMLVNSVVRENYLIHPGGPGTAPGLILTEGSAGVIVSHNLLASIRDDAGVGSGLNSYGVNTIGQMTNPAAPGYYTLDLAASLGGLNSAQDIASLLAAKFNLVAGGGGRSAVQSSLSQQLDAITQDLTLTGAGAADGTGNLLDNVIKGNDAANRLLGGGGADHLAGGAGSDFLRGEDGNDLIYGGGAFDDMLGNAGSDTMYGGAGGDWVVGGKDNDFVHGELGDDVVYGNLGADTAYGGAGSDWVRGGQGDDSLSGGDGDDFLSGDLGADVIYGGRGADRFNLVAGSGSDRVMDFSISQGDRVVIEGGGSHRVYQSGADTVVEAADGSRMILVAVDHSQLTGGWVI